MLNNKIFNLRDHVKQLEFRKEEINHKISKLESSVNSTDKTTNFENRLSIFELKTDLETTRTTITKKEQEYAQLVKKTSDARESKEYDTLVREKKFFEEVVPKPYLLK